MHFLILFFAIYSLVFSLPIHASELEALIQTHVEESTPTIRVLTKSKKILVLDLEEYLMGVIGSEMHPQWPQEALKAQAVASRSYALAQIERAARKNKAYDVSSTIQHQVFKEGAVASSVERAVMSTEGQVLVHQGEIVESYFHSTCGGRTESARGARLNLSSPIKGGVHDTACQISPSYFWKYSLSERQLREKLSHKLRGEKIRSIKIRSKTSTGRADKIEVRTRSTTHTFLAVDLRRVLGTTLLKSLNFQVNKKGATFYFEGRGYGHGVGLCQYGAKAFADKGWSFEQILEFYYSGIQIQDL